MCGITGWLDYERDLTHRRAVIEEMTETLEHRGPDAGDTWITKHVAFGHRRLVIIDPEGGWQPMVKRVGERKFVITYNGEIYNMQEVRLKLLSLGFDFVSRSDTELILTAYIAWGNSCVNQLNGIFAFAIWDEAEEKLFLARDRIGVKPLFYAKVGSSFLFGSELKSLLAHPHLDAQIDDEGLSEVLLMGPARTPGVGIFKNVEELKPGHFLQVNRDGIKTYPYWELTSADHTDDFKTTIEKVRYLVQDAIERQLVSDVPVGTMLSGGLDSSAISALSARFLEEEGEGCLRTFSVDYTDNDQYFSSNEFQPNADAPWAKLMVDHIQSTHQNIEIGNEELLATLLPAMRARDLPGMADIDASLLLFCKEIKKTSTVILSGECADEVFGGYPWFHREELVHADTFPWSRLIAEKASFLTPEITSRIKPLDYVDARYQEALCEVPRLSEDNAIEARMREMFYLNLTRWMPTLLDRKDRMSMAAGLEVRVPFCDHHLVEYVWNVPWSMKNYNNREKGLLRHALKGILPEEIIERKKSPYPKTHHPQYLQAMRQQIAELIEDSQAPLFNFIDREKIRAFVAQDLTKVHFPWFGQLMNVPALLAYWIQINQWMIEYKVSLK